MYVPEGHHPISAELTSPYHHLECGWSLVSGRDHNNS